MQAAWHSGSQESLVREMHKNPVMTLMMAQAAALCAGLSSAAPKRNVRRVVPRVGSNVMNSAVVPPNAASMHAPFSNWQTALSGLTERTMFPSSHPEPRVSSSSLLTASFRISMSLHLPWVHEQDPARRPVQPFQPEGERHHPVVSRPDRGEVEELDHCNAAPKQRAMDRPVPGKRFDRW